jgi:ribosomal protein S12 methylthiotransferase
VDSDILSSHMERLGWKAAERPEGADVVVVNTCSFIAPAVEEAVETTLEFSDICRESGALLVVAGCLVERYGKEVLSSLLPEVDLFITPGEYHRIGSLLGSGEDGGGRRTERRVSSTLERGYVYIKVAEGCNRRCRYCTLPDIKGPLVSRKVEDIVEEASYFVRRGAGELVLVAQDTPSYGMDLYGRPSLPLLLEELAELEGDYALRVLYLHPRGVDGELLRVMEHARILPYFDLPFQHVDDRVLRLMGRNGGYRREAELIEGIREAFPDASLRATFMVGYPGEDEKAFRLLLRFVEEFRFDWLGLFRYSQEEGTPAYRLGRGAAGGTAAARIRRLEETQDRIMREKASAMVGRTVTAMVEGSSEEAPGYWEARSWREAPEVDGVIFLPARGLPPSGRWLKVEITASEGIDLVGRIKE